MTRSRETGQRLRLLARGGLILTVAFALTGTLPAGAQDASDEARGQVLADRARTLADDGRCADALGDLERARTLLPRDASVALLQGQCRIATRDYVGAQSVLREAKQLDPDLADVDLYLGVALYHVGDYPGAWASLQMARGNVSASGTAELEFYTGLLQLERGRYREAALALERAQQISPSQVEPVASFYAGVAWQTVGEHELARENLRRTIEVDGEEGPFGRQARELLSGDSLADRTFGGATIGLEYDTNVALVSEAIALPAAISDQSDGRFVWQAQLGAELFRVGPWSGGLAASYQGRQQFHLTEFNSHYPVGTVWVDRELDVRSFLRGRYDIGYGWLDRDPYVLSQTADLGWHHNWGRFGNSEVALLWEWYEFLFPTALLAPPPDPPSLAHTRDRSGQGVGGALRHRIPIPSLQGDVLRRFEANGSFTARRYWAEGSDWDYALYDLRLGFDSDWLWQLGFDVWGSAGFMPFDHPSSYGPTPPPPQDDRKDFIGQVQAELERPLGDVFSVSGRYHYIRNESNVEAFNYSRHVVGAYLNARF